MGTSKQTNKLKNKRKIFKMRIFKKLNLIKLNFILFILRIIIQIIFLIKLKKNDFIKNKSKFCLFFKILLIKILILKIALLNINSKISTQRGKKIKKLHSKVTLLNFKNSIIKIIWMY